MPVDEPRQLVVRPQLRCYGQRREFRGAPCCKPAIWQLPGKHGAEFQFFCDECKPQGVEPIARDAVFRRITIDCAIELAAVSLVYATAQAEAEARLINAVHGIGGVFSRGRVSSVIGRLSTPAGQWEAVTKGRRG